MKLKTIISKTLIMLIMVTLPLAFSSSNYAYASKEEVLDLEEEKSDIEDKIEERRAGGKCCSRWAARHKDIQDEIDNVREEG